MAPPATPPSFFRISVRSPSGWSATILTYKLAFLEYCSICTIIVMHEATWVVRSPHRD